jgi:hypothetical protein
VLPEHLKPGAVASEAEELDVREERTFPAILQGEEVILRLFMLE